MRHWLLATVVALGCVLAGLAQQRPQTLAAYDQPLYLGIASDLLRTGIYGNGRFGAEGVPGAYTAPLYPAFVAALAALDPSLAAGARCVRVAADAAAEAACPRSLGVLLPVQVVLMVATLLLVWRSVLAIGGSGLAAGLALLAAGLLTTEYAIYARTAMTEALSLPLAATAALQLVMLVRRPRPGLAVGFGLVSGLLALCRPEYLYLSVAIGLVGLGATVLRRRVGPALLLGTLCAALTLAPWSVRNARLFGTVQPTFGYSGFILAQRMAYEAMTPREWAVSWLYALPGFGPAAARAIAPDAVGRLGWEDRPDTFYMVGNTTAVAEMDAAVPDPRSQVGWLLRRFVWAAPLHFAAVTAVLSWKALWVRKIISLVGVPCLAWLLWDTLRRRDPARLAFLLPPLFILVLHGATTVATPRYSLNLIPAYAAAIGLLAARLVRPRLVRS